MNVRRQIFVFFLVLVCSGSIVACRQRQNTATVKREVSSNISDIRYGITSGVFTRIFAKNVCSCMFVSGLHADGFNLPFCMEQSNLYFALNIKGVLEPVYLDWIMKIQATVTPMNADPSSDMPIYVIASGLRPVAGLSESPDGVAVFDPKQPEFGCRLVAKK